MSKKVDPLNLGDISDAFPVNYVQLEELGKTNKEMVNHPKHYNQGTYEVIDVIEDWGLDFSAGSVVKYVARYAHKENPLEDLKKAKWYIDRLIEIEENKTDD